MRTLASLTLCLILVNAPLFAASSSYIAVSPNEALGWIRHTIPLPKQIEISGKVILPTGQVALETGDLSTLLAKQAVKELREVLGEMADEPSQPFRIVFQLGGDEASVLKDLKNSDQAYRIVPTKKNDGLQLIALTPRGLYYAAKTLQQLIRPTLTNDMVAMPILTVTDWPDMADRGVWGTDTPLHMRWLGDRKINYMEQVASTFIDKDKRAVATMNTRRKRMIDEGPMYGFNPVPALVHLERLDSKGIYEAHPELKGIGENVHPGAACYSNPKIVDILAEWMIECARLPGVTEIDAWMTENLGGKPGCQCDKCRRGNRDLLEARAILNAWNKAKKTIPDIGLRILVSEETADSNEQILAILPKNVTFWYYHSLTTYSNHKTEIIPDYVEAMAAKGYRMGIVPDIGVKGGHAQPFTSAHFIRYRMNEFVSKNIAAMLGYPRPRVYYSNFNMEAAAEWSWNAKGRSTREFALSWAIREGYDDPETFADWSETLGPVSWDVYGSEWPRGELRCQKKSEDNSSDLKTVGQQLKNGTLPELGEVLWEVFPKPWGDIKSVAQLNDDVTKAAQAVKMAQSMNIERYLQESRVIQGYINSLKALYELKQIVTSDGIAANRRETAGTCFQIYIDSLRQAQDALPKWEDGIGPWPGHPRATPPTVKFLQTLIDDMTDAANDLGFELQ